jgi:hypothetical protein
MVVLGMLTALAGMAIGLLGLVGLIRPKFFFGAASRKRVGLGVLGAFALFIAGLVIVGGHADDRKTAAASTPAVASSKPAPPIQQVAASAPPPPAKPAARTLPADQAKFVAAIAASQHAYREAKTEMAQGGTRAERRAALCAVLKGPAVQNWIGTVADATSANDGRGVLEVKIADKVAVKTTNNSLSDTFDHTLIEPGSAVFKSAVELKKGDTVQFSGVFFQDDKDCVKETSISLRGSMTEPEFLFRFTVLKKL